MDKFTYDYFGYRPTHFIADGFMRNGYTYKYIEVTEDEKKIEQLDSMLTDISKLTKEMIFFHKNRYNLYLSKGYDRNYALLVYFNRNINIDNLKFLHQSYVNKDMTISLENLINLWEEKVDFIEKECMSKVDINDHYNSKFYDLLINAVGYAENAMQYLSDANIDYGENLSRVTLTHKRLAKLDFFDVYNPLNFIYDNPVRDIADLYKNGTIDIKEIPDLIKYYQFDKKELSVFLARIIFPTTVFDIAEDGYNNGSLDREKIKKLISNTHNNSVRISNMHYLLVNSYGLREISWLYRI